MPNWKKDRIGSAIRGENPAVLAKMKSGFAVFGDTQFLEGYCLLLASPKIDSLNDLSIIDRNNFLMDMTLIGDAIQKVCSPIRINYSILGNTDPFLHAHIFPRYTTEPNEYIKMPVWFYPKENWTDKKLLFDNEKYLETFKKLQNELAKLIDNTY